MGWERREVWMGGVDGRWRWQVSTGGDQTASVTRPALIVESCLIDWLVD